LLSLAYHSEGFSLGAIREAIEQVLIPERIERLDSDPLIIQEFIEPLAYKDYVSADIYNQIKDFIWQINGF
jgi:hypothetical protein